MTLSSLTFLKDPQTTKHQLGLLGKFKQIKKGLKEVRTREVLTREQQLNLLIIGYNRTCY